MLKITYDDIIFNNQIILNKAEIEFDKGITTLIGENGSGKTTILNLLYREQLDFNPKIALDDTLISEMNISEYRNTYMVYISQSNILFSNQSISQALELIVGEYDRDLYEELCDVFMFREVIKRNPKVAKLSGGEKQKLKILCGLLKNVKVVLFDEPFNNLDQKTIANLNDYLKADDKYFIITSHIDLFEDYTQYKIENKKINYKKAKNYHETINVNTPKHLSENSLKGLRNANRKIRIPLYIVNVVVVIILMLAIANTLHVYRIATIDRSNFIFGDTATLIKAPIENDSFLTFGTEEWLEKTPTYFSDEDIARLESLSYVESVIPVKSDGYGMNGIDYKNKFILDIPATEEVEYNFSSALYPKQVAENLPSQSYITGSGFIESFVTGTFPNDNNNEAIVDTYAADYIIANTEYDNYNQLVGQVVAVPVFERDNPNKKSTIDFVISGVFKPIESIDNSIISATIVPGFNAENRFVQSTYTQYQTVDEIYGKVSKKLEVAQLDTSVVLPEDIPSPAYDSLYIETKTPEDVEKFTEDILKYDQFIEVENNYLYSQSINFKYLSKVIRRNMGLTVALLVLFIIILWLLFKLYKNRIEDIVKTLVFYAYDNSQKNKFISYENKEYLLTILVINLIVALVIQFGYLHNYSLVVLFTTNTILFMANYVILKIIMKGKVK